MTTPPPPLTVRLEAEDVASGFRCGSRSLDDFFARHALPNDRRGIGTTYVLRREVDDPPDLPRVWGYFTLSMSLLASPSVSMVTNEKLPRYPMPVGLIGKLASDERTRGRGLRVGETLLLDAISRVLTAAESIGCVGIAVDAKDAQAEAFYLKYGFVTVEGSAWPHKMFLPLATARGLF
jgi:hypothetical protein